VQGLVSRLYGVVVSVAAFAALGWFAMGAWQEQNQQQQAQQQLLSTAQQAQQAYNQQVQAWYQTLVRGQNAVDFKYYFTQFNDWHQEAQRAFGELQQQAASLGIPTAAIEAARQSHAQVFPQYTSAIRQYTSTAAGSIQLTDRATIDIAELNQSTFEPLNQTLQQQSAMMNTQLWQGRWPQIALVVVLALGAMVLRPNTQAKQQPVEAEFLAEETAPTAASLNQLPALLNPLEHPLAQSGAVANVLGAAGLNPQELDATVHQLRAQTHELEALFDTQRQALSAISKTAHELVLSVRQNDADVKFSALQSFQRQGQEAEQSLQNLAAQTLNLSRSVRTLGDIRPQLQDLAINMTAAAAQATPETAPKTLQEYSETAQRLANHTHLTFGVVQRELGGLVMNFKQTQQTYQRVLEAGSDLLHQADDWQVGLDSQQQLGGVLQQQLQVLRKVADASDRLFNQADTQLQRLT